MRSYYSCAIKLLFQLFLGKKKFALSSSIYLFLLALVVKVFIIAQIFSFSISCSSPANFMYLVTSASNHVLLTL